MTRLYAAYRDRFADQDPSSLSKNEKEIYDEYVKFGERIKKEAKKAKDQFRVFEEKYLVYENVVNHIENIDAELAINENVLDSLSRSFNPSDAFAANVYNFYLEQKTD